jgi:hypothetical protein
MLQQVVYLVTTALSRATVGIGEPGSDVTDAVVLVHGQVKVTFTLEQVAKVLNLGARWGGWSMPLPGRFTPGKDPVPTV